MADIYPARIVSDFLANSTTFSNKNMQGGTIHKEIFEFERVLKGPYKGQEFDKIVKKVVDEWGEFVKNYV